MPDYFDDQLLHRKPLPQPAPAPPAPPTTSTPSPQQPRTATKPAQPSPARPAAPAQTKPAAAKPRKESPPPALTLVQPRPAEDFRGGHPPLRPSDAEPTPATHARHPTPAHQPKPVLELKRLPPTEQIARLNHNHGRIALESSAAHHHNLRSPIQSAGTTRKALTKGQATTTLTISPPKSILEWRSLPPETRAKLLVAQYEAEANGETGPLDPFRRSGAGFVHELVTNLTALGKAELRLFYPLVQQAKKLERLIVNDPDTAALLLVAAAAFFPPGDIALALSGVADLASAYGGVRAVSHRDYETALLDFAAAGLGSGEVRAARAVTAFERDAAITRRAVSDISQAIERAGSAATPLLQSRLELAIVAERFARSSAEAYRELEHLDRLFALSFAGGAFELSASNLGR